MALALATLVLGALLSGAATQTLRIARVETRYQALLTASRLLLGATDERFTGEESGEEGPFRYSLGTGTVPADPRVDQVRVTVEGPRGIRVGLQAYRLRSQHQDPGATP